MLTGVLAFSGVGPNNAEPAQASYCPSGWTVVSGGKCSRTFGHTGAAQPWTVPSGITTIEVDLWGAAGGTGQDVGSGGLGGRGARVQATLSVTPNTTLNLYVGGRGTNGSVSTTVSAPGGFNGGGAGGRDTRHPGLYDGAGGGGATDIRIGGTAFSNRVLIAAGGGGGAGGGGASNTVGNGGNGGQNGSDAADRNTAIGGKGATQASGGAAFTDRGSQAGSIGNGGAAGNRIAYGSGGGGGGLFGGGAGSSTEDHGSGWSAGGGGGSSFVHPTLSQGTSITSGYSAANGSGSLKITYLATPIVSSFSSSTALVKSQTVSFNLVMSSAVEGLASHDFDITGTAAASCAVGSFNSASNTSFTIPVTCTSDGTVRLTLKQNAVFLSGNSALQGPSAAFLSNSVQIDTTPPALTVTPTFGITNSSNFNFVMSSSEILASVVTADFEVSGTGCTVGTPTGPTGSAPNLLYSIPVTGCADAQTVTLTLKQGAVQDAAGNTAPPAAIVSSPVIVDLTAPTGFVSGDSITNSNPVVFTVSLSETIQGALGESNFTVGGTGCSFGSITPASSDFAVALTGCQDGTTATLTLKANSVIDLAGNSGPGSPVVAQTIVDRSLAAITIDSPASPNSSSDIAFAVNLGESTNNIEESDFEILSPITFSCTLDTFNPASPRNSETGVFSVGLSGCAHGDQIALQLKQNSVQDDLGNLGPLTAVSSSYVVIDLLAPVLVSVAAVNGLLTNQSTITYSVTFNESVTGLNASMFTLAAATSCSSASLTGSLSSYTVTFTGCASDDEVTMTYALTDAVLDLAGNPLMPVTGSLPTITVDTIAPSITSLTKTQSETSVAYRIDFSEEVVGFTADDIQFAGTSAAGSTWSVTNLVAISATRYQFTATNPSPDSGTLKFSIITTGVTDLAGNELAAATFEVATVDQSEVTFYFLPTISLGSLSGLGAMANSIAPAVTIDGRGNSLFGLRVTLTNAEPEDVLTFTNNDSSAFGTIQSGTHNSVLTLTFTGAQPTAAQWQAAARNITFATTSLASVSRSVTFAIRPTEGYSLDTGRFYEAKSSPEYTFKSWADSFDQAASYNFGGLAGYMVNITSQQEQNFVQSLAVGAGAWIGLNDVQTEGQFVIASGPEAGQTPIYTNWASSQPSDSGDYAMMSTAGDWYDIQDQTAEAGSLAVSILIVEFGGSVSDPQTQLAATAPLLIDSIPPTVVGVSGVTEDGTYYRGEELLIAVEFSEPVIVTGAPRLLLETGTTDRYANYVSGSGTVTAVFSYEIESGDLASDLDFESNAALEANSGTLTDLVGNPAVLTLPTLGAAGSLAANAALVVDGVQLSMVLATASTSSTVRTLSYSLTATDAIDCSTLSLIPGEDLDGTLVESIDSVVASGDNKTCTIGVTSAVMPAQFGTTTLTYTQAFSVSDQVGNPQTNIRLGQAAVVLTIPAAAPDMGEVTVSESPGVTPQRFLRAAPAGLLPDAGTAARAELNSAGVVQPVAGLTSRMAMSDISGVLNPSTVLHAMSKIEVAAGEQLVAHLKVHQIALAEHIAVSYFDSGNGWVFSGVDQVQNSLVETEPVVFTTAGSYMIRILLLPAGTSYPMVGQGLSLPAANQSQHWEVLVTGTVPTFVPPPPTQPQGVLQFPTPESDPASETDSELEEELTPESETCSNCAAKPAPNQSGDAKQKLPLSQATDEASNTAEESATEENAAGSSNQEGLTVDSDLDSASQAAPGETEEVIESAPETPEPASQESMLGWFVLAVVSLIVLFGLRRFQTSRQRPSQ